MLDLTPTERRGVLVLLALVGLGAAWDLAWREPRPAPEPPVIPAPAVTPGSPATSEVPPGGTPAFAAPLDLNAAGIAELDRLPGIGPVLAGRIVAHREAHGEFRSTEDLLAVPGIGPRLYARIAPLVTIRARREPRRSPLQIASPRGG